MVHDLNSMKLQFSECSKNKKEIEICKNISERISLLFYDIDVEDLQLRIGSKRVII